MGARRVARGRPPGSASSRRASPRERSVGMRTGWQGGRRAGEEGWRMDEAERRTETTQAGIGEGGGRDGCYPSRALGRSATAGLAGAQTTHGEVRHPRRRAALRHDRPGREQEQRAAAARCVGADRGRGRRRQRPADPGRRRDAGDPRGHGRARPVDGRARGHAVCGRRPLDDDRAVAVGEDPRVVSARRPAPGPLRAGGDVATGRRRDRPPASGSPPRRVLCARSDGGARRRHRAERAGRPAGRATCSWTRRR